MKNVILFSISTVFITLMGSIFPVLKTGEKENTKLFHRFLAVSSGLLIGVAFVSILPEAFENNKTYAGFGVLLAFVILYWIEGTTMVHACLEYSEKCDIHLMGWVALTALAVHSLIDGCAIGSGFISSTQLGILSSSAVSFHKFADGFTLATILLFAGFTKIRTFLLVAVLSFATPIGAVATFVLIPPINTAVISLLLGFSAGSFIYIASGDILPRLHRTEDKFIFLFFTLGIILSMLIEKIF